MPSEDATDARLAADARALFDVAVRAVHPERSLGRIDWARLAGDRALDAFVRVELFAVGKGALPMTEVAVRALTTLVPAECLRAQVTVPYGYAASGLTMIDASLHEAAHPVPDAASERAARHALDVAHRADAGTLLVVLVSGGASSLWALPADGLALDDLRATSALLLRRGATIHALNTVRKHLSAIAGGRLAVAAHPAFVRALVVSDVVGDEPSVIGSGPTVADPTTYADAIAALHAYDAWLDVPYAVRAHLERGACGEIAETPKSSHPRLATAQTDVVGCNADALDAVAREAVGRGYRVERVDTPLTGEARAAGEWLARRARAMFDDPRPTCLVAGGETTVRVVGDGRGGRNQELALAAALALDEAADAAAPSAGRVALLSGGTDGVDGPTDAAGACIGRASASAMRRAGVDPADHLRRNDAYPALDAIGAVLRPGPTHVNVMDVQIVLTARGSDP